MPTKRTRRQRVRRLARKIGRRVRLLLPVALVTLLVCAIVLPLSPRWLATIAGRKASEATGLTVTVERVRVSVMRGEVVVEGLEAADPQQPDTTRPVRIEEVRLDGHATDLLAGDGRWPTSVTISIPSPFELRSTDDGLQLDGPWARVIEALGRDRTPRVRSGDAIADPSAPLRRRTPELHVRGLRLFADAPAPGLPPIGFNLYDFHVAARPGAEDPYIVTFDGTATTSHSEGLRGSMRYLPHDRHVFLDAELDGVRGAFPVPLFGEIDAEGRGLRVVAQALRRPDDQYEALLSIEIARFESGEGALGGERWIERDLLLDLRGSLDPASSTLHGVALRLVGEQIDARLDGEMELVEGFPTDARLRVGRLPAGLLNLARREAAREGFLVDFPTSASLSLDMVARGPLLIPEQLQYAGTLAIDHWRVREQSWHEPLAIHRARGTLSNELFAVDDFHVSFGELDARGTLSAPLPRVDGERALATAVMDVRGPAETLVPFLRDAGIVTDELASLALPIEANATARFPVQRAGHAFVLGSFEESGAAVTGQLAWGRGELVLQSLPALIVIQPGEALLEPDGAACDSLRVRIGDIILSGAASIAFPDEQRDAPFFTLGLAGSGPLNSLVEAAESFTTLPPQAYFARGLLEVSLGAHGELGNIDTLRYEGSLILSEASGRVPGDVGDLALDNVFVDLRVDPSGLWLEELRANLEGLADIVADGEVTAAGGELRFVADAEAAVATRVAPRDLDEIILEGRATAQGTALLLARDPLPEGADVPRAWLERLAQPGALTIGIDDAAPLRFQLDARIETGAEGNVLFQRDFPHRVTNVHAVVFADERGFTIPEATSSWGDAHNILITNARVDLGTRTKPLTITFEADIPEIDINDWMEGWSEQPWAARPDLPYRPPRSGTGQRQMLLAKGVVFAGNTRFLSVRASDAFLDMEFESWRGRHDVLRTTIHQATVYDGSVEGEAEVQLGVGEQRVTRYSTAIRARDVQANGFMVDLLERPHEFRGRFTGEAAWTGTVGDYSDWRGEGEFHVRNSRFIGAQVFTRLNRALNLGGTIGDSPTTITGRAFMSGEQIRFPDMQIQNAQINLAADGSVRFNGDLDFLVNIEVLTGGLSRVPLLGTVLGAVNAIKDRFVAFRVSGKIGDPQVGPAAPDLDPAALFRTGRQFIQRTGNIFSEGERAITGGLENLRDLVVPPEQSVPVGPRIDALEQEEEEEEEEPGPP